ncbi:hypothetical protein P153DRAFT_261956, partial [Dothidotthia symphoricarpi CBS 119687]
MANEEQRRAFASYMGTASSGGGQAVPEYPGAVAQPGNPFLYSGGFAQGGFGQGGFSQSGIPQRPPPLGASGAPQEQQSMRAPVAPGEYANIPSNYTSQPPPLPTYNAGYQYTDPMAPSDRRTSAAMGTMTAPRNFSGEIVESRQKQTDEYYHYQQHSYPPAPPGPTAPQHIQNQTVPVLLCHTCSECGKMRSAGFHRNNPVIPGKPVVTSSCRRCKKKMKSKRRSESSYTRIRTCIADEPCDWPREAVHIDMNSSERRGRRQSREEVYLARHSPSRPRIVREGTSQTRIGLRVQQQDYSPARVQRRETIARVSSLSPRRASRYGEVWPPPDVVRMRPRSDEIYATPTQLPRPIPRSDEVWPPPDVVRTHSGRKVSPTRQNSRIIELSPSPPPIRTRSRRFVYHSESQERRPRIQSVSPARGRVSTREERRSDAELRMASHPRPYRALMPDQREYVRESDETSTNLGSGSQGRMDSPNRGILKPSGRDFETAYRRRTTLRDSQQSTSVEVGGPR